MKGQFQIITELLPYIEEFNKLVEQNYIFSQVHPKHPLRIYNYAKKTQYEANWNPLTLMSRGLVLDTDLNIIARPFPKFFNKEELTEAEIPNLPFETFEKMDGSLGIGFWYKDEFIISSRGSFASEQAIEAQKMIVTYPIDSLPKGYTYLFEIIYPSNRIVVDYKSKRGLVLLGAIHTESGEELTYSELNKFEGFEIVKRYDNVMDYNTLKLVEEANREGFVIRFSNGFRMKIKFETYVHYHKILSDVSSKSIWETLKDAKPIEEILERVPDEIYKWVRVTKANLEEEFNTILTSCKEIYNGLDYKDNPKWFALEVMKHVPKKYKGIIFGLNKDDYKSVSKNIWKLIKPEFQKPFKNDDDGKE